MNAFGGLKETGRAIGEDIQDEETKKRGAGFRKQANRCEYHSVGDVCLHPNNSRTARELRAVAAERRTQLSMGAALHVKDTTQPPEDDLTPPTEFTTSCDEDDGDFEIVPEDDAARRERLFARDCTGQQEPLMLSMASNTSNKGDITASNSDPAGSTQIPKPRYTKATSYVQQEINDRQKESMGSRPRTIGATPASRRPTGLERCSDDLEPWVCAACTL